MIKAVAEFNKVGTRLATYISSEGLIYLQIDNISITMTFQDYLSLKDLLAETHRKLGYKKPREPREKLNDKENG